MTRCAVRIGIAMLVLAATLLGGCPRRGPAAARGESAERVVATSFLPTAYFAERIAGGCFRVECLCPREEDPALWKPSREVLERFQRASLVVLNGAGYETWAASAALAPSRVVDTSAELAGELLVLPGVTHNHGAGGVHSHEGTDGHTWMDPRNAAVQAAAIRDACVRRWPEEAAAFEAGYEGLRADLMRLDARLAGATEAVKGARMFASHPAYGYIARRYGWRVVDVDAPPDVELTAEQWAAVGDAMRRNGEGPRVLLFEEEPRPATRERLRSEWGAEAVVFDPCERGGEGTYVERMNRNVDRLSAALQKR